MTGPWETLPGATARTRDVLVLGGSGFVGRSLCERLVERSGGAGGRIVVPTRRLKHARALRSLPTVDLFEADVHDDRDLAELVARCDVVVNLIAILHGSREQFARVHVELPNRIVEACRRAHVGRIVHVSALGVGADAPSNYLKTKTDGEALLTGSGLAVTALRPSVMFGTEDRFLNLFAKVQQLSPVMPLARGDAKFQPVWVEDVATAIATCIDRRETIGKVYECAGPKVFTLSEIVALAGRWAGHERPQIPLPGFAGRLQAFFLEHLPGEPMMSRDNLDSMAVPNVASGRLPGLADLGIEPAALEAVAPGYLGASFNRGRFDRWRANARRG